MTAKELQDMTKDENVIRQWLKSIKETDHKIIDETLNLMRSNPEYRKFIMDYVK